MNLKKLFGHFYVEDNLKTSLDEWGLTGLCWFNASFYF